MKHLNQAGGSELGISASYYYILVNLSSHVSYHMILKIPILLKQPARKKDANRRK